jgi:hypothetical protein
LFTALGVVGVLGFNFLIDPFDMNHVVSLPHLNLVKPEFGTHVRQSKAFAALRLKPGAIVLGSSRAEVGIDAGKIEKLPGAHVTYNLAVPSASMSELLVLLRHARFAGQLQSAIVGLDFFMFNGYKPDVPGQGAGVFLKDAGWRGRLWVRLEGLTSYMSLATATASLRTVIDQGKEIAEYDALGGRTEAYEASILHRMGSYREASRRIEGSLVRDTLLPPPGRKFAFTNESGFSTIDDFSAFLREARAGGVQLVLFISPEHARQLEVLRAAGLWERYEEWKRLLVRAIEAEAAAGNMQPYALWDFSGYNRYTTERLPASGEMTPTMRWYWETSHYRRELGDRILAKMLGGSEREMDDGSFGVRLTDASVEGHLVDVRDAQARYHRNAVADVREVEEIVCGYYRECARAKLDGDLGANQLEAILK